MPTLLKVAFLELLQEAKERKKARAESRSGSIGGVGQAEEQEDDGGGADDNGWEDFQGREGEFD